MLTAPEHLGSSSGLGGTFPNHIWLLSVILHPGGVGAGDPAPGCGEVTQQTQGKGAPLVLQRRHSASDSNPTTKHAHLQEIKDRRNNYPGDPAIALPSETLTSNLLKTTVDKTFLLTFWVPLPDANLERALGFFITMGQHLFWLLCHSLSEFLKCGKFHTE